MTTITFIPNENPDKKFLEDVNKITKAMFYLANKREPNWDKCNIRKDTQIFITKTGSDWIRQLSLDNEEITDIWREVYLLFYSTYLKKRCIIKNIKSILFSKLFFISILAGRTSKDSKVTDNLPTFEIKIDKDQVYIVDLKNTQNDGTEEIFQKIKEMSEDGNQQNM